MKIGAHVSISGGLPNSISKAIEIGANTIQIFASPPRNWHPSKISDTEATEFAEAVLKNSIDPVLIHAIYLVNLASDDRQLIEKSKKSLIDALNFSSKIMSRGVIFHIGSNKLKSYDEIKQNIILEIDEILAASDPNSKLIIETNAGQGNCIGCTFEQIAEIINGVKAKNRLGVCLDTAHVYESGYDIKSDPEQIIEEFDNIIGLNYLKAIHCNDSKTSFNSRLDRHENIGQGELGLVTFRKLLNMPKLASVPFILEVPGYDDHGPDKKNIEILKGLIEK